MAGITVDELQVLVTANTKQLQKSFDNISSQLGDVQNSTSKFSSKSAALFGVVAGAAQALAQKGINLIGDSVGYAIKRVDTLANANNVFKNLGFSALDTKSQMDVLVKSIDGLPTSLDDAVGGVEALASVQGNLGSAVATYKALNDGILGMGGSADMVNGAILQLSQLPMDGPLDAQTWNSLRQNGMAPIFTAMAKDSHMSISQLKDAFGTGQLTVKDFTDKLIKMDKDGGGGMASLAKQAKDNTHGIGTSFGNVQIAVGKAMGAILTAIGSGDIANSLDGIKQNILKAGNAMAGVVTFIKDNKNVFGPLAAGVAIFAGAVTVGVLAMKAYEAVMTAWKVATALWTGITTVATGVQAAFNAVLAANPIALVILAVAALVAGLIYFFTQTDIGRKIVKTAFDAIQTAISAVWNWVKDNWPLLLGILAGPIGLAVALILTHLDTVKNSFSVAWNFIKGVFSSVGSWFGSVFNGAWSAITRAFSGVSGFFNDVKNRIIGAFSGIGSSISSFFHNIWGSVGADLKSAINAVLHLPLTIPKINIPHVGTVGGQTLIPRLARGGIIDSATLALVGESGKEAVMPLENNTGWIDELAGKLNAQGGGQHLTIKIGEDTILDKVIGGINDRSFLNGTSVLHI